MVVVVAGGSGGGGADVTARMPEPFVVSRVLLTAFPPAGFFPPSPSPISSGKTRTVFRTPSSENLSEGDELERARCSEVEDVQFGNARIRIRI